MNAIRITQRIESDTLYLPQLRQWLGKHVEILVRETAAGVAQPPDHSLAQQGLAGSVLQYEEPFSPAEDPEEWESNQ